jgi:uncharacterized membrane protein (DUF106 family)
MSHLNAALRWVFDTIHRPLAGLPAMVGIVLWSVVAGVLLLLVFKHTSNQVRLAAVKRRIHACLFEIRLFNDDLVAILRAQGEILRHNAAYLALSLKPLLWMIVPLVLVIGQLQYIYGYRGFEPGERFLLTARFSPKADVDGARPPVWLELPDALEAETDGVWVPSEREMTWRLVAVGEGDAEILLHHGDEVVTKSVRVTDRVVRLSPLRPSTSFLEQLTWPAESPLPEDGPVHSIELDYPAAELSLLGFHVQSEYAWMAVFFVLSIVVGFAIRKPLGVTI